MRYRLFLAGFLHAVAPPAFADGAGRGQAIAAGYAEGEDRMRAGGLRPLARQTGVVPLTRDAHVDYELGVDDEEVRGRVTTRYRLSRTEMLNLRLERESAGAYWSRRLRGREQRIGLFSADFGVAVQRLFGWEYADGYALGNETPSRSAFAAWSGTPLRAAARPPLGGPGPAAAEDAVGRHVRETFAREHGRVARDVRGDMPIPGGRRDFKLAAGGSATTGAPFFGGVLRQGLSPEWTVEAGGYADEDAGAYARSRVRIGKGLLKLETSGQSGGDNRRRATYVYRNAAVAAEQGRGVASLGARLYGSRYYAAIDHGLGDDGDSRVAIGFARNTLAARLAVHCEASGGEQGSHYCGVGLQLPLQRGARPAPARRFFNGGAERHPGGGPQPRFY